MGSKGSIYIAKNSGGCGGSGGSQTTPQFIKSRKVEKSLIQLEQVIHFSEQLY